MFVCLCNGLRQEEICEAIAEGASCAKEVYCRFDCKPVCGLCIPHIEHTVRNAAAEGLNPA